MTYPILSHPPAPSYSTLDHTTSGAPPTSSSFPNPHDLMPESQLIQQIDPSLKTQIPLPTQAANIRSTHLRALSQSSVSSSGSHIRPASHSHTYTPSLQPVAALPNSATSSPALQQVPLYPYTQSPVLQQLPVQLQHPPPQQVSANQAAPYHAHLPSAAHAATSVQMARSYHPNMPSVPTPLKRSISDVGLGYQNCAPTVHPQPQYDATPEGYIYASNGAQAVHYAQNAHSSSGHFPVYLSPSCQYQAVPQAQVYHPSVGMAAPYHFAVHPSASVPAGYPVCVPPSASMPQVQVMDITAGPYNGVTSVTGPTMAQAATAGEEECRDPLLRAPSPTPSATSDSGCSSYSQQRGVPTTRGGRSRGGGRGGARGRGTKRKGSGWTKRKSAPSAVPARESSVKGRQGARMSVGAEKENVDPDLDTLFESASCGMMSNIAAADHCMSAYAPQPPPLPAELEPTSMNTTSGAVFSPDAEVDPAVAAAAGIPPDIATHLRNLQPGPLIQPPTGCGLQIGNLLIHVPAAQSEVKEVQDASKKWCHVIDASGTPIMLDAIRPNPNEQYTCRCCRKTYTGKNARSVARRHLQDKHGVPLQLQERRSRWDKSTGTRTLDRAEAYERDKESKRKSAQRAREMQRKAKANIAAKAKGDTSIYTPPVSKSGVDVPRKPLMKRRLNTSTARNAASGTASATGTARSSPRVPISPDFSLNSEGSPIPAGTGRHNTPIEMIAQVDAGSSVQGMQVQQGPSFAVQPAMGQYAALDQRFEQTRQLLRNQGWSEADIAAYYAQVTGAAVPHPHQVFTQQPMGWATSQAVYGHHSDQHDPAAQPAAGPSAHANTAPGFAHKRTASMISLSSDSSWVHVDQETPDYAQLRDQQTWTVPPPSVPYPQVQRSMSMDARPIGYTQPASSAALGANADAEAAEEAAAGLMEMSSPIKGPPVKKKARPTPLRRANTITIPAAARGIPLGWPGFVGAKGSAGESETGVNDMQAASVNDADGSLANAARAGVGLTITTQMDLAIEPAPLSAPVSGASSAFFPAYTHPIAPFASAATAAQDQIFAADSVRVESPLAYLSNFAHGSAAGPSRLPRQPFARGRAHLARSISFSLPSTGSPIRMDDLDVFSQMAGKQLGAHHVKGDIDDGEGVDGRESKRARTTKMLSGRQHGRTQSSDTLEPFAEQMYGNTEGGQAIQAAGDGAEQGKKAKGSAMLTTTATGSPITRLRRATTSGGGSGSLGLKRKQATGGANARFMLGMSTDENGQKGETSGAQKDSSAGAMGANGKPATSPLQSTFTMPYQTATGMVANKTGTKTGAKAMAQPGSAKSPMFKLAANAYKTPLKQRDLNLAPTLSELQTPAKLGFTTPAPLSRLEFADSTRGSEPTVSDKASQGRSVTFEPYSTDASSATRPSTSARVSAGGNGSVGSSMLTSLAPSHEATPLSAAYTPRRSSRINGAGSGTAPASVTRNWADLSSPAHAGLAHQLGLTADTPGVAWRTPNALRGLGQFETPGMMLDAEWDD